MNNEIKFCKQLRKCFGQNTENSLRLLLATSCNNPHTHFPLSNESWLRPTTVNMTAVIIAWENHIRQNIKNNLKKSVPASKAS